MKQPLILIAKAELNKMVTFDIGPTRGHAFDRIAPDMDKAHAHLRLYFSPQLQLLLVCEEDTGRLIEMVPAANIAGMQVSANEADAQVFDPAPGPLPEEKREAESKGEKGKK